MRSVGTIGLLAALCLVGCDSLSPPTGQCNGDDTKALAVEVLSDAIENKVATDEVRSPDGSVLVSRSAILAALKQVEFGLRDIRTTKRDPDSSRNICAGVLAISFPKQMMDDISRAHDIIGYVEAAQLARNFGFDQSGGAYTIDLNYSVQPTDDRNKIFVEVQNADPAVSFVSDLVGSFLMFPRWQAEHANATAEAERSQRAQEAALKEQRAARLLESQATQKLSEQSINAVWEAIDLDVRQQLLELQRAWIRRKEAECKLEGMSDSADQDEQLATTAYCETRMNRERETWLRQYLNF